jgi:hypothetical protein
MEIAADWNSMQIVMANASISMLYDQNAKRCNIFRFSMHIIPLSPEDEYLVALYNILDIHLHQYLFNTASWDLKCNAIILHKH